MKKLLICLLVIGTIGQLKAQDITGSWQGQLNPSLSIIFNITRTDTGYAATFDVPAQKISGAVCSKAYMVKDSLFIEMAVLNGGYKGLWNGKGEVSGAYSQNGAHIPLALKRITVGQKTALNTDPVRAQTPKPPYNYFTQDVEYDNASKTLHYGATFTRPNGSGKYPAVIIISGSGTQDRNGSMMGHKPYWVLADYLTKQGIAVLRVDDRGAGKSSFGSNINGATTLDFSYDVEASLNYLESRPDVDKRHLGLIGHSEGGIIAPMVAARRKDVSFIVMWAGPAAGGGKTIAMQESLQLKKAGLDSVTVKAFTNLEESIFNLFATSANTDILDQNITLVFDAWKKQQTPQILSALNAHESTALFPHYNGLYKSAWMRFLLSYDPEKDLSKVTCPVLAINGTKDTQVDANENLGAVKAILTKNGNKDFETIALPGLNHLLQDAQTGDVSEYEKIPETLSPSAMNIISTWIKLHTK